MNLAQIVQSHALSFFHLSVARPAVRLRRRPGRPQPVRRGGRPSAARPGRDRTAPLRPADHRTARRQADPPRLGGAGRSEHAAGRRRPGRDPRRDPRSSWRPPRGRSTGTRRSVDAGRRRLRGSARSPRLFLGLVGPDGERRALRRRGCGSSTRTATGSPTTSTRGPTGTYLGEAVEPWSYLKSAYWT